MSIGIYKTDTIAIRKIMAERNIRTILELSQRSGIGRNTLAKVLNGEIQPSSDTMEKLVFALDIPPERAGTIFFNQSLLEE